MQKSFILRTRGTFICWIIILFLSDKVFFHIGPRCNNGGKIILRKKGEFEAEFYGTLNFDYQQQLQLQLKVLGDAH